MWLEDLPEGEAEIIVLYPSADREQVTTAPQPVADEDEPFDYLARLLSRQPVPLSDEADCGER